MNKRPIVLEYAIPNNELAPKTHKQQLIELKEFLIECSELLSLDGQGTKPRVKEKIQEKIKEMNRI